MGRSPAPGPRRRLKLVEREAWRRGAAVGQVRHLPRGAAERRVDEQVKQPVVAPVEQGRRAAERAAVGGGVLRGLPVGRRQVLGGDVVALILVDEGEAAGGEARLPSFAVPGAGTLSLPAAIAVFAAVKNAVALQAPTWVNDEN